MIYEAMIEGWVIPATLMIAAVLAIRFVLRGKISLRLQYALWSVVLVRLLVPGLLFISPISTDSVTEKLDIPETIQQVYFSANEDVYEQQYAASYNETVRWHESKGKPLDPVVAEQQASAVARQSIELDLQWKLFNLWLGGMALMTAVIVSCNVHLACKLRKRRWAMDVPASLLPVYVTEAVPTPCVFGCFRPAIYLTPEAAKGSQVRAHVLEHELTHYRHGDHIWSLLRSLCLVLHWYNPLVWVAAKVSRADAELACDEGALTRLGESQRGDYGRTLIGLTCSAPISDLLLTATTMTGSAGSIRERIRLLMKRPRNTVLTLTAVILMVTLIVGCTFSTAPATTTPATEPPTTEPSLDEHTDPPSWTAPQTDEQYVSYFNELLNPYNSWYAQALTSYYNSPAEIDLFQLFYNGIPGVDNTLSEAEQTFLENQSGYYNPDFDMVRIPGQDMRQVLNDYFGIDLESTAQIGLQNFIYDPATDCYYHCHTDTNASSPTVTAAYQLPDGNWQILYTNAFLGNGAVTLCAQAGTWQITSNLPIESTEIAYALPMEQAMADYADRNPRELTEEEVKMFRTAFSALLDDGTANPAACFLTCYYSEIYEMDGSEFLAYFPTDQDGTKEEFELLKAKYPDFFEGWTWEAMPIPIHRYDPKAIDAVVTRYANIHWPELDEGVHYLEETGCYYNYTSDFGLGGFYAKHGFVYDGGAVIYSAFSALYLTETAGTYTIQAHYPAITEE